MSRQFIEVREAVSIGRVIVRHNLHHNLADENLTTKTHETARKESSSSCCFVCFVVNAFSGSDIELKLVIVEFEKVADAREERALCVLHLQPPRFLGQLSAQFFEFDAPPGENV